MEYSNSAKAKSATGESRCKSGAFMVQWVKINALGTTFGGKYSDDLRPPSAVYAAMREVYEYIRAVRTGFTIQSNDEYLRLRSQKYEKNVSKVKLIFL